VVGKKTTLFYKEGDLNIMKTKGELIVACIKLMFDNDNEELDPSSISDNPNYSNRTANIIESINRAITEIVKAKRLPKKTVELDSTVGARGSYRTRFNLDTIVIEGFENDVYSIDNIAFESDEEDYYENNIAIKFEGNQTILLPTIDSGKYIVSYSPKFKAYLKYSDADDTDIETIPDELVDIIPHFVKGELYEEDDPQIALLSTNKFFGYLGSARENLENKQTQVKNVYNQLW
jgi:hypothetical protein